MTLLSSWEIADPYWLCIQNIPCQHDGEDLKKLSKDEYMKTMQCRIERHLKCIDHEIDPEK